MLLKYRAARLSYVGLVMQFFNGGHILRRWMVVSIFAAVAPTCSAQSPMAGTPADNSSPRATLKSFITAVNDLHRQIMAQKYYDRKSPEHILIAMRVLDCLDSSELPAYDRGESAGEAAVYIKEIIDRFEIPPWDEIPDSEAIEQAGGLEKLSHWRIPGTRITISRMDSGPRRHEYLFSAGTIDRAAEYYRDVQALPYRTTGPETTPDFYRWYSSVPGHPGVAKLVEQFPEWLQAKSYRGMPHWKWLGLLISTILALLLVALILWLHRRTTARFREGHSFGFFLTILFPVALIFVPLYYKEVVQHHLTLRGTPLYAVGFFANLFALTAGIAVIFGLSNRIALLLIAKPNINPQGLDAQFIRIVCKILSLLLAVIVFLEGGNYLGIPVTTLIASAGIGGLAIALAAQDTLRNLFGTLMLLTDKPFRVGERIVFQNYDGVVEDIGLRSTRVRLLTGHQATIPNDELARNDIENVGRRPFIRRVTDLKIPINTPSQKLELAIDIARELLQDHAGRHEDYPPRVYFLDFAEDAFVLRIMYWYTPADYWDFLAMSEAFNFQLYRQFEQHEIALSMPQRISHTNLKGAEQPVRVESVQRAD